MNKILIFGSVQSIPLYNCSAENASPFRLGTPHPILGWFFVIFSIIAEILYFPCIFIMIRKNLIKYSCYKIMLFLGIDDMMAILLCGTLTGYFFIEGAIFCTHPELIYVTGCILLGGWVMACWLTLILVLNRIWNIFFPNFEDSFFKGYRFYFVMILPILYFFFSSFFTKPILFSSNEFAWLGDPEIHKNIAHKYFNNLQYANDVFFIFFTIILYIIFMICIQKREMGRISIGRQIIFQSTLVSFFNLTTATIYTVMMHIKPTGIIASIGQITWLLVHSSPAIIYLSFNKSIRGEVVRCLNRKKQTVNISFVQKKIDFSSQHRTANQIVCKF